jgi:hypothetical protein
LVVVVVVMVASQYGRRYHYHHLVQGLGVDVVGDILGGYSAS